MFGWGKQHGTVRNTKHRGLAGVAADFLLNLIGFNLICIPKLLVPTEKPEDVIRDPPIEAFPSSTPLLGENLTGV